MFSEVRVKTYLGASLGRWKENNLLEESSKGSLTTKKKKEKKKRNLHETSSRGRIYGDFIAIGSHKAAKAKIIVTFDWIRLEDSVYDDNFCDDRLFGNKLATQWI